MGTTTWLLFKKGNRVSASSLSFLLKLTLMRIDLLALELTELPPNQATSSHKGALLQAAPPTFCSTLPAHRSQRSCRETRRADGHTWPRKQRGIRNSELACCCLKAVRCNRWVSGARPVKPVRSSCSLGKMNRGLLQRPHPHTALQHLGTAAKTDAPSRVPQRP